MSLIRFHIQFHFGQRKILVGIEEREYRRQEF